jgi:hypothetical protein
MRGAIPPLPQYAFMACLPFTEYCDKVKEDEVGGTCSMCRADKCVQHFYRKI